MVPAGVWPGEDPNIEPEPVFIGRWEFQQFITNAGNFFNQPADPNLRWALAAVPA